MGKKLVNREAELEKAKKAQTKFSVPLALLQAALYLYAFALLVIQPLYVENGYYNIGSAKWNYYCSICYGSITAPFHVNIPGFFFAFVGLFLWYLIECIIRKTVKEAFSLKRLTAVDVAFLLFLIFTILSTVLAKDKYVVLWGYDGWYMGFMSQLSFFIIYLFYTLFFNQRYMTYSLYVMALAGCFLTVLIGVIMRLGGDPLGLYSAPEIDHDYFVSTIGNRGWYTAYVCLVMPIGMYFFWQAKSLIVRILSGLFNVVSVMMIAMSNTAAAFLAFAATVFFYFLISCRGKEELLRFLELSLLLLLSFRFCHLCRMIAGKNAHRWGEKIWRIMVEHPLIWVLILFVAAIYVLLRVLDKKGKLSEEKLTRVLKIIRIVVVVSVILGAGGLITYIALNSLGKLPASLSSENSFLKVDKHWGSHRLWIWSFTIKGYLAICKEDPMRIFFGLGPNNAYTVGTYSQEAIREMMDLGKNTMGNEFSIMTDAHNEWLTQLVNLGLLGGGAYLACFLLPLIQWWRRSKKEPLFLASCGCIVAYLAHEFFSYQTVVAAPYAFILLAAGAGLAHYRSEREGSFGGVKLV